MEWIIENKEWIFSGVGVVVISTIVGFLFNKNQKAIKMKQKSGKNSTNIQIGGDYNAK